MTPHKDLASDLSRDLNSARIELSIRNHATQTVLHSDPGQTATVGDTPIRRSESTVSLLETTESQAILSMPPFTCALGHGLELSLRVIGLAAIPFEARVLGQVSEMERDEGSRQRVTVTLRGSALKTWAEFRGLFERRQAAIQDYLKQARGY